MDEIVQDGDEVLRKIAEPVAEHEFGTQELASVVHRMIIALDKELDGVALAAPQIAISKRIFIVRYDRLTPLVAGEPIRPADIGVFINPEFEKASRRREEMDEGCLSVRGLYGKTYRHQQATISARSVDGKRIERGGGGILAQVFQHEIDHLDGILFIDHAVDLFEAKKRSHEEIPTEVQHED